MSRKRHRSVKRPSPPPRTATQSTDEVRVKVWPYRECDFESYDNAEPLRAAELEAAEVERFYANLSANGRLDQLPKLPLRRANVRAAARREFEKRGEEIPRHLVETADDRAAITQAVARWCAEFNAHRADSRRLFEARGEKVPDCLQHRQPCNSLEAELARAIADNEAVRIVIADIEAETGRLRAETAAMRARFDSSSEGQEILRLQSERRQTISNILQVDIDIARANRNADLLLSFCDYHIGSRPPNLPPPEKLSRYSTDLAFLTDSCRSAGFNVPTDLTTVDQLSKFVRSEVPPVEHRVTKAAPASTESETQPKTHRAREKKTRAQSVPVASRPASLGF